MPPATSTRPSGSKVEVCDWCGTFNARFVAHIPLIGSYSSVLEREPPLEPPVTITLPLARRVAAWAIRPLGSEPVLVHVPVEGSYNSALFVAPPLPAPP